MAATAAPVTASVTPMAPRAAAPAPIPMSMTPPPSASVPPTDALTLRAAYGAPDFVRREMDSELWRYDGQDCAAFFFLYREGEIWRLRYSETMPRGRDMPADAACLSGISLSRAARMS